MGDQEQSIQSASEHWEESKRLAEVFYFQYIAGEEASAKAIDSIAELIHYGDCDLVQIQQRMAL